MIASAAILPPRTAWLLDGRECGRLRYAIKVYSLRTRGTHPKAPARRRK